MQKSVRLALRRAAVAAAMFLAACPALAAATPNTFTIYVDCPGTPFTSGHAWFSLTAGSSFKASGTTYTYGYHPGTWDIFGGKAEIKNDAGRSYDHAITFTISDQKYINVANFINGLLKSPGNYDLLESNCVGLAENAAGVAGVKPPNGVNRAGIQDPYALCSQFDALTVGGTYNGGLVYGSGSASHAPPPVNPLDFSYVNLADSTHGSTASQCGAFMNLPSSDSADASAYAVAPGAAFTVNLLNAPSDSLLSIDWGDGSDYSEQLIGASHLYASPGTYDANIVEIDAGQVLRRTFEVTVGGTGSPFLDYVIPTSTPATGTNDSMEPDSIPADIAVVPEPGVAGLGVVTMAALGLKRRPRR